MPGGSWSRFSVGVLLCFVVGLAAASPAEAADSWGYDLGHDLMSPYCPGRTLATCPSPQAAELVQWIVLQEAAGATREEVLADLVERFGEEILGAPKAEGFALWAYVLPILGFVSGGGLAFLALRRIVARRDGIPEDASPSSADAGGAAGPEAADATDATDTTEDLEDELARIVDADLGRRA